MAATDPTFFRQQQHSPRFHPADRTSPFERAGLHRRIILDCEAAIRAELEATRKAVAAIRRNMRRLGGK